MKTKSPKQTFGTRLRAFREAAGLSCEQLADRIGSSRQAVYLWEADRRDPVWRTVCRLAKVFGVTPNDFL